MTFKSAKNLAFALALGCIAIVVTTAAKADEVSRPATHSGIIRVKSAYTVDETVTRLKQDIASKGIKFFDEIDQAKLAAGVGIQLRPSRLLLFGNPPLGIQFLTANPYSGIDWPVRMLVLEDAAGQDVPSGTCMKINGGSLAAK